MNVLKRNAVRRHSLARLRNVGTAVAATFVLATPMLVMAQPGLGAAPSHAMPQAPPTTAVSALPNLHGAEPMPVDHLYPLRIDPVRHRAKASAVAPFRTLDPSRLAIAKQQANVAWQPSQPSVSAPNAPTAPQASLYNNLNQPGISALDEGACCTPPDTTGSIGPTRYVEIVNNLVRVHDRALNRISDMDLGTFTGTPTGLATSDPQMQWDPQGNRWFYAAVAFATGNNYLLLGWSKTADPSDLGGGWCHYGLSTANLLQDYPKLGHDNNYVIFGANEYDDSKTGLPFVTAVIWALPKPAVGDASCAVGSTTHFGDPTHVLTNADGSPAFTPIPVSTFDSSSAGYIVAAHSPMNTPPGPQTKVMAWHLVKGGSGAQLVADGDMTVRSFNIPPAIPQPGPSLDSLDARLTQAVGLRDPDAGNVEAVWTQHTVASTTSRSVVRWYELLPSQRSVREQGEISSSTDYFFNAAISPSTLGNDAALFYNRANASLTPVLGAVSRTHGDTLSTMGPEIVLGNSVAADQDLSCSAPYGPPCRWGDYSGASPDPSAAGVIWGSNQLNGPAFFGYPQWVTRNFAVAATVAPDYSLAISPTGRAVTGTGAASYTVTISGQGGFTGPVTLSAAGLPAGAAAAFSPNPATTTSTMTINTVASTPPGTSQITVTGVNGALSHMAQTTLVVDAASSYASTITADAPNAFWRLGETTGTTLVDETANASNGTYVGGFTLSQPGAIVGDPNGAVTFNGVNGFATVSASSTLNLTGALSLEAWVKFASVSGIQAVVNKGDGVSAAGSAYELAWIPGTGLGFQTFIGGTRYDADQNVTPTVGKWYHMVGTRTSSGLLSFYINGTLVATANDGGGALNNVAANVGLAAAGNGSGQLPLNGTLDEVAIYPIALTASQVASHWRAAGLVPGAPTNVAATAGTNQATVSWTPPPGSITTYTITPSVGTTLRTPVTINAPATSATVSGLSGGSTYSFTVVATNSLGSGTPSAASNAVAMTGQTYPYAGTILADHPIGYWRLGETSGTTATDATGNGNAGTYAGGYTQGQSGGPLGDPDPAVLLDGSTGWVAVQNAPSLQLTGALTLEAWLKFASTSGIQAIVNKGDGVSASGSAYELAWIPGTGLGFQTFIGGTRYEADQNVTPTAGKWYHLVGTRSAAGQLSFYVNGALAATGSDTGAPLNNVAAGIGLGASGNGTVHLPLNGTLDEVAIYPGALTASQVLTHWQAGAPLPGTPQNVQASATVNNQATVSWTPATSGGAASSFIVMPHVGSTLRTPQSFAGSVTSGVVTGLSGGVTYTFSVVAVNSVGNSPQSMASNAVSVTGASYPYSGTVLGDGAVAYWRLGETFGTSATDASGNGNSGTYTGGYTQGVAGGVLGDPDPACAFNGSTGYVGVPNAAALRQTGALSLEAWVKFASTSGIQIVVNKGDGQTASGSAYEIAWIPGTGLGFQTFIGGNRFDADQNFTPAVGQWYYLVGTRSASGQLSFYVNGSLVATGNDGGGPLNDVAAGVGLGASGDLAGRLPLNGTLDEVAIYPAALTATQVSGHYHAGGY